MTIVLGSEDRPKRIRKPRSAARGIRDGQTWEQRRLQRRDGSAAKEFPTWQPRPDAPRSRPALPVSRPEPARHPGMIGLYTDRVIRQVPVPERTRRIADRERTLAGGVVGPAQARRSLAIVEAPRLVGRGSEAHYRALHPALDPSYGRLRSGHAMSLPNPSVPARAVRERAGRAFRSGGASMLDLVDSVFVPAVYGTARPRVNTARRILVGTVAAFMVLVGATGTGFAGQQRYEARDGETVETVAATFGVDPEAIRRSSSLPSGDALAVGQVIVIPEPGQGPSDAATMAAERERTRPSVKTAHWVASGDTLAAFNELADPANLPVGSRVLIPATPGDAATAGADESVPDTGSAVTVPVLPNDGTHVQQHNLSCKYAAAYIATSVFGNGVPESAILAQVPAASNPHSGYRGDIGGWCGNTTDYGVYPEALVPVLSGAGFASEVMYTGGDTPPLTAQLDTAPLITAQLDTGFPVLVWLGFWGDTRETLTDQDTYAVFAGMHVVTVHA